MNTEPEYPRLTGPPRSLDDLLGLDADPVLGQDAQDRLHQRLAEARGAGHADTPGRRWPLRLLLPSAAAAAAAVAFWMTRADVSRSDVTGPHLAADSALIAGAPEAEVSDDLLASLSVLENMDFITEELDPFDADALFLFEAEDQVLFDLLVSEDYAFDGQEGGGDQR